MMPGKLFRPFVWSISEERPCRFAQLTAITLSSVREKELPSKLSFVLKREHDKEEELKATFFGANRVVVECKTFIQVSPEPLLRSRSINYFEFFGSSTRPRHGYKYERGAFRIAKSSSSIFRFDWRSVRITTRSQ